MIDISKADKIYRKSLEVLGGVQLRAGGCLATLRNERYPYVYPRDHSIVVLGFLSAGMFENAKRGLDFVFKTQLPSGAFPQRVDEMGRDASYKSIQVDGTGLVIYALAEYVRISGDYDFARKHFSKVEKGVEYIRRSFDKEKGLIFTPNSIHEFPPMEEGFEVWANATCFGALVGAYGLSKRIGKPKVGWADLAKKVKKGVLKFMWSKRARTFLKTIRVKESSSIVGYADASKLSLCDFGMLKDLDSRVEKMTWEIQDVLWHSELGGLCRYPKFVGRNNGGWGPWPHFTLMAARHFIRKKDLRGADRYLGWVIKISFDDLLPEHIATRDEFEEYVEDFSQAGILRKDRMVLIQNARKHPMFKKGLAYITLPLAWPHAEFIRTLNLYKRTFFK